jgi:hypothetical protein
MATTIEERLTRLERKNRRLTLALMSVGMAAIVAVAMGQGAPAVVPQEVTAHKLTLVSNNGELQASLMMGKYGPELNLYDEKGKLRVSLSVYKEFGPELALKDENGRTRVSLWVDKENGPNLSLDDENDKMRAGLWVSKEHGPELSLLNENGGKMVSLTTLKNSSGLYLWDENGKSCANLTVHNDIPALVLEDKNGKSRGSMMMLKNGPNLSLDGENGKPHIEMGLAEGGGGMITVSNPFGKEVVSIQSNKENVGAVYVNKVDGSIGNALIGNLSAGPQRATSAVRTQGRGGNANVANSTEGGDNAIETQIDGDFEGWEGETIVKLTNGQIWQQSSYYYEYYYAYRPEVLIYRSGSVYKMKVEGTDEAVEVKRLK